MKNAIVGAILVIIGVSIIAHRLQSARKSIEFQNKVFGFHFGKKEIQATTSLNLLIGLLLIGTGILTLLGIFEFK